MATTVAQHSVATFTSPVNGTTPIDANTVRGNDNTIRSSYNDHDADPGIHVQSSTLASRPVAGTAGRKWITEDSGVYTLWFDDGTNWHPVSSENVALTVLAGENLVKGDVVKVTGWNNGQDLPEVVKTTSAADTAFAVITATVSSGSMGYATNTGIVQDVNTAAYSVGTILYANGSGGFTSTKPTSGNYQPVAYVLRSNVNNGVYYVEFSTPRIVERSDNTASTVVLRDSNGDFSAGTITATAVNATTLDLTNLEVTNIKAKDGTQAIAIADTTGKLTISDGVLLSALTASQAVFTDGSKNLVSNAITGTGNVVMSASPTLTGTVTAATLNATTLGGTLSTAAQPNVTSVGTLSSLTVSGTTALASSSGNVSIGTTFNNTRLHIQGTNAMTAFTGTAYSAVLIRDGDGTNEYSGLDFSSSSDFPFARIAAQKTLSGSILSFGTSNNYSAGVTNTAMSIDPSGNLAVDTNTLYVDAANNNVGIGTASPTTILQGSFSSSSTGLAIVGGIPTLALYDSSGTTGTGVIAQFNADLWIFNKEAGSLLLGTSNVERARLDASGNLGLGVTPSAWGASRYAVQVGPRASFWADTTQTLIGNNMYATATTDTYIASAAASLYVQGSGIHKWFTAPSGTAGNAITFTQAAEINASGEFTVAPGSTQSVKITTGAAVRCTNTTNTSGFDVGLLGGVSDATAFVYNRANAALVFGTNNSERARITSGGYTKHSNDGTYFDATGAYHEFRQTANNMGLRLTSTVAGFTSMLVYGNTSTAAGTGFDMLNFEANGVGQFRVRGDGTIFAQNTTVQSISDARLKENIVSSTQGLDVITALRPVRYDWKPGYGNDRKNQLGFIAQEMEAVFPDAVSDWEQQGETYKTVGPAALIPVLVKAIQELDTRLKALEA